MRRFAICACLLFSAFCAPAPAAADFVPVKVPVDFNTGLRIQNEDARHDSVLKELEYEREDAARQLKANEKLCNGNAHCLHGQRLNYVRSLDQLDVQTSHENLAHAQRLAAIKKVTH